MSLPLKDWTHKILRNPYKYLKKEEKMFNLYIIPRKVLG